MSEVKQAIEYFEKHGFIEELTSDKRHYVKILMDNAKKDHLYEIGSILSYDDKDEDEKIEEVLTYIRKQNE